MSSSRRRLATILGLFAASLFCIALVLVRNVHSGDVNFRYLIWNLFLAWIPFVLAIFVYDRWRRRRRGVLLLVLDQVDVAGLLPDRRFEAIAHGAAVFGIEQVSSCRPDQRTDRRACTDSGLFAHTRTSL